MLRSLVLILLIVNAAFFAWSHGWLNNIVGVQPDSQHEPQRMAQQIHADKIVVARALASPSAAQTATAADTPASAADAASMAGEAAAAASGNEPAASQPAGMASAAAATPANEAGLCVEAGPFSAAEYNSVEATLRPLLPAGSWSSHTVAIQGLWLVYMGPYGDADMLERKQTELRRIKGLNFEEVRTPANLALGLSLGRYGRLDEAEAGLNTLRNRGIRTARIVNIRPNMDVQVIKIAHATVRMQVTLAGVKLPQGKGFTACRS